MSPGTKAEGHFYIILNRFFLQIDTALLLCSLFEYGTYCLLCFLTEWEEKCNNAALLSNGTASMYQGRPAEKQKDDEKVQKFSKGKIKA